MTRAILALLAVWVAAAWLAYRKGYDDGLALAVRAHAFQEQWERGDVCCYDCGTGPWRCSWMP